MKTHKSLRWSLLLALLGCFSFSTAFAASTLHIGTGSGTTCAEGCAGDPNILGAATSADIYQTSNGAATLSQPVLLIFGVPSQFDHLFPTNPVSNVVAINPYPGGTQTTGSVSVATGGTYGLINPVLGSYFGTMSSGQEVYSFLNLGGANNSESFTNWSAADLTIVGINVTGFAIHVFAIDADLGPDGLINFQLAGRIPKGTFVVAYGQANGRTYDTPFTEAGLKTTYYRK